MDTN
jgi:hypothetical protein